MPFGFAPLCGRPICGNPPSTTPVGKGDGSGKPVDASVRAAIVARAEAKRRRRQEEELFAAIL